MQINKLIKQPLSDVVSQLQLHSNAPTWEKTVWKHWPLSLEAKSLSDNSR